MRPVLSKLLRKAFLECPQSKKNSSIFSVTCAVDPNRFLRRRMNVLNALILTFVVSTKPSQIEGGCTVEEFVGGRKLAALIPARSGSKGVKHKNLSRIGNETILARSLNTIHRTRKFNSVWVSTDGTEIAEEAVSHGAKVHWRDPSTATDEASTLSAVQDFLRSHSDFEILAVVQCTSPFLQAEFLSNALLKMTTGNFDCLFSATRVHNLRWTDNADGFASPVNFDPANRPRRQDWRGELVENGMFYIVKTKVVTEEGVLQNNRCGTYEIPYHFALEIDTPIDLSIARAISTLLPPN